MGAAETAEVPEDDVSSLHRIVSSIGPKLRLTSSKVRRPAKVAPAVPRGPQSCDFTVPLTYSAVFMKGDVHHRPALAKKTE